MLNNTSLLQNQYLNSLVFFFFFFFWGGGGGGSEQTKYMRFIYMATMLKVRADRSLYRLITENGS